jgi:predicted acetyltransferase
MERLYHVIPDESYREQAIEYVREFERYNSHVNGSCGLNHYINDYDAWLEFLEQERNRTPDEERVPSETYMLIRENDNRLIGMINIRLALNDTLRRIGGHIGYSIRPTERGNGYNEINLYLALLRCQEVGLDVVLLDCDNDNIPSYRSMEALGGYLIYSWDDPEHGLCRRYGINVERAINKYHEIYESRILRR